VVLLSKVVAEKEKNIATQQQARLAAAALQNALEQERQKVVDRDGRLGNLETDFRLLQEEHARLLASTATAEQPPITEPPVPSQPATPLRRGTARPLGDVASPQAKLWQRQKNEVHITVTF